MTTAPLPPPQRPIPSQALAAMIAILPLPGSPCYRDNDAEIIERALEDLAHYIEVGVDCIVLENSHDLPYIRPPLSPAPLDFLEHLAHEIRARFPGPIGLQILEAANLDALEIAARADLDFLRVEGYVFAHVGGAGIIEGCAGPLLRRRKELHSEQIRIFGDVKKKHCSHALTGDLNIAEVVRQSEFFLVDGVIVTGPRTGAEPEMDALKQAREAARGPVWIGSGLTPQNIADYLPLADGFIVGSTFRENGAFLGKLERPRLDRFIDAFQAAKGG